ncbi:MAG TPA: M23 family metallopeptidase [Chitinophagales bacterium]|jgi:murein DD-endopeptidase MepM/ murein hydrolase activator NlpD|nr:M23 family metallopeptidase [Chitinophagales bacterium]MBP6155045.1 M23 family metallopeptidase [Chitinophagales bacterium]HQV77313.1 M23 family metallopeptidase [Chitinophagales bacterium]HQW78374.1 M23 family metallopeptidase [Chitinophagales bacterium]HRB66782.1 M23 family metallopeptidase [Chitinophagales bacterium]
MKREKYFYNPNTLKYEKYKLSIGQRILQIAGFFTSAFFFGFLAMILGYSAFDNPEVQSRKIEMQKMEEKYDILDKRVNELTKVIQDLGERDDNIYRVIFESEPLPDNLRSGGINKSKIYAELKNLPEAKIISQTLIKLEQLEKKAYVQSKSHDQLTKLIKSKEAMLASIPAIQPISNEDLKRIASGFGFRIDPVYKTPRMHAGLDFTAETGTPVYATGDGVVEIAGSQGDGYGNKVVINHGYGYETLYGHNSKILVHAGEKVKRGQTIALVGSTGKSTGPHCHYEVWKNGVKIDPVNYFFNDLSPEQYNQLVKIAEQSNQAFD